VLDGNSITSLEKERFISSRLTELEEISVNGCEIETVNSRALSGLRNLALLSVCGKTAHISEDEPSDISGVSG